MRAVALPVAALLCLALGGCSASLELVRDDPAICAAQHSRACVGQLWLYFTFPLE